MRRVARHISKTSFAFSLLAFLVFVVLWHGSYRFAEGVAWQTREGGHYSSGRLYFNITDYGHAHEGLQRFSNLNRSRMQWDDLKFTYVESVDRRTSISEPTQFSSGLIMSSINTTRYVAVPLWAPLLVSLALPIAYLL